VTTASRFEVGDIQVSPAGTSILRECTTGSICSLDTAEVDVLYSIPVNPAKKKWISSHLPVYSLYGFKAVESLHSIVRLFFVVPGRDFFRFRAWSGNGRRRRYTMKDEVIVEIRAAEGGADAKLLVRDQHSIYCAFASRERL